MNTKILKNWKILLMILCLVWAVIMINPLGEKGVVVKSISSTSPFNGKVTVGEKIEWANDKQITTISDMEQFENFTGVFKFMHSGKLELVDIGSSGFGITFDQKSGSNIQLGMDLVGGTRVLLQPMENVSDEIIQQTKIALETRINTYGLAETIVQPIKDINGNRYIQIEMAGGSRQEIENLLSKQGRFEGKIPIVVPIANNTGTLKIGDESYPVYISNETLKVDNNPIYFNKTFQLDNIDIKLENYTSGGAVFVTTVFKGTDITSVCMQDNPGICTSRIMQQASGWQFMFQIFITQESAEKFAKVTQNMKVMVDPNSGESYLDSKIYLFLDDNQITSLSISSDLAGKAVNQPTITGGRPTKEEATQEKLELQSILKSGALPVGVKVIRADDISPSLGKEFASSTISTSLIAILAVAGVIFIRYRKIKILLPMMAWTVSEFIITLGVASAIHWTLDMASIAGLIGAIGTGTNDQIMMVDEMMLGEKEKVYTLKQKVKKSFGIVISAAATIVAAMLPLFFVGIGVMKGFAITTTIGILIGVFITRSAFATFIEQVIEKDLNKNVTH